jgi:DNA polymerase-3 subunit delta'
VIVDGADETNRSAANALLKVLEEPPRRALLLLVAHSPGRWIGCRSRPISAGWRTG